MYLCYLTNTFSIKFICEPLHLYNVKHNNINKLKYGRNKNEIQTI